MNGNTSLTELWLLAPNAGFNPLQHLQPPLPIGRCTSHHPRPFVPHRKHPYPPQPAVACVTNDVSPVQVPPSPSPHRPSSPAHRRSSRRAGGYPRPRLPLPPPISPVPSSPTTPSIPVIIPVVLPTTGATAILPPPTDPRAHPACRRHERDLRRGLPGGSVPSWSWWWYCSKCIRHRRNRSAWSEAGGTGEGMTSRSRRLGCRSGGGRTSSSGGKRRARGGGWSSGRRRCEGRWGCPPPGLMGTFVPPAPPWIRQKGGSCGRRVWRRA